VSTQRPDLLMTEFFPLGREECRHEIVPALVKASAQGAAIWSVVGYPLLTGGDHHWRRKILDLYQRIFIFSPALEKEFFLRSIPQEDQRRAYLDFFDDNAQKITFAGYLLPRQTVVLDDEDVNRPKPPVPRGACRVAVLRGGGAYFPKVIVEA